MRTKSSPRRAPAPAVPLWLIVPQALLALVVVLFGGALWSVAFRASGLDTSAQQYGSTPFIFGLWFATVVLVGVLLNASERLWRRWHRAG